MKPVLLFFLVCLLSIMPGCAGENGSVTGRPVKKQFFALDTLVTLTIYDAKEDSDPDALLDECEALCKNYEEMFSRTIEDSDIDRLNKAECAPVNVSPETLELLETALSYSALTDGLFDITIAPVSVLWEFRPDTEASGEAALPDPEALSEALIHVSYKNLILDTENGTVSLSDPEASVDLGAIAKGYIADRLKEKLLANGVNSAIIDLGGNILTIGKKPDGSPFRIAVKKPFSGTDIAASLPIENRSVVTSGIYERYFELDDKIYHHVLDPNTGFPIENELASVTIISDDSLTGDCLSTACLLLGKDASEKLVGSTEGVDAVFIERDGTVSCTEGLKNIITFQ
ncbi:MAG: FAD:protein FMN transferase [Lachnospiraceae bacterium]|nr:FAD:protein FMN transferase [Lachnospiraceae bacterium]